jgi:PTH2 family peptidyl-tRNA hydrolase
MAINRHNTQNPSMTMAADVFICYLLCAMLRPAMKRAIVIRSDLQMSTGKLAVQACHASVAAVLWAGVDALKRWEIDGQTKIALGVHSLDELENLKKQCEAKGIIHAIISDAGRTEVTPGTVTAPRHRSSGRQNS